MSPRILVVEDEPALLAVLEAALDYGGFAHDSVLSGAEALARLGEEDYQALLLDLGLPDMDGRSLLRSIRQVSDIPILICSGIASEADKVEALDLGADDLIEKPFLPGELLARIRAALRRHPEAGGIDWTPAAGKRELRHGALLLDLAFCTLRFEDREVHLSESECRILKALFEEKNRPVSRASLLSALYDEGEARKPKIAEVYLMRVRRKPQELTGRDDLIQNVRGRGWALRE